MEIVRTISLYSDMQNMPFVLIGGHAINAYGIQRQTGDVDLLVRRSQREKWQELFEKIRYAADQSDDRFIRYKPNTITAWPIDLMLVDDETFSKLLSDSHLIDLGVVSVNVVSPRHLVTLKLHALKVYQQHRYAKDYTDIVQLLRQVCTDLRGEDLRSLCARYADETLYEKLSNDIG
jgi:hypothetical protein